MHNKSYYWNEYWMFFYNSQLLFLLLTSISFSLYFLYSSFACCCCFFSFMSVQCIARHSKHTNAQEKRANFMRPVHLLGMHNYSRTSPSTVFPLLTLLSFFLVLFTDIIYIFSSLVAMVRGKTNFLSAALTAFFGNMTILWHTHVCVLHMCVCRCMLRIYVCVQVLKLNTY